MEYYLAPILSIKSPINGVRHAETILQVLVIVPAFDLSSPWNTLVSISLELDIKHI